MESGFEPTFLGPHRHSRFHCILIQSSSRLACTILTIIRHPLTHLPSPAFGNKQLSGLLWEMEKQVQRRLFDVCVQCTLPPQSLVIRLVEYLQLAWISEPHPHPRRPRKRKSRRSEESRASCSPSAALPVGLLAKHAVQASVLIMRRGKEQEIHLPNATQLTPFPPQ